MNLILKNPYRTLGLLVGATAKEQGRQVNRLKKYIEVEEEPPIDFSFPQLGKLTRSIESINDAESKINLDRDKVNAALFWFWNGNPISDDAAFEALKDGDLDTAFQIWDKLVIETKEDGKRFWKEVTKKNYSAFHNLFIINFFREKANFKNGIVAGLYFIESDLFDNFIQSIADKTYKANKKELQLYFLNKLFNEIEENNKSLFDKFLDILNHQEFISKKDFFIGITNNLIEKIEKRIQITEGKREAIAANAVHEGKELINEVLPYLDKLKSFVGENDLKYSKISDKVADELYTCSVKYFNYYQENGNNDNYFENTINLAKQAENFAVGNITKNRIKENLNSLKELKDIEITQAIEILQSIVDAYETNRKNIIVKVKSIPLGYNSTIDWDKVSKTIDKSIDWDKVVEVILKVITKINVEKIKNSNNTSQKNKYRILVEFIISKLTFSQVNKIKYIAYWRIENEASYFERLPSWVNWTIGIAIFIIIVGLIVGLIWGEEGLIILGCLAGFFVLMIILQWLNNIKYF